MNKSKWIALLCLITFFLFFYFIFVLPQHPTSNEVDRNYDNSRKWIIDSIYLKDTYYYTIAHNLQHPRLGVKIEDTIKPTYSQKDTIKLFTK